MHPTFMIVICTLESVGARDCHHSKLTLSLPKTKIAFFHVLFLIFHMTVKYELDCVEPIMCSRSISNVEEGFKSNTGKVAF